MTIFLCSLSKSKIVHDGDENLSPLIKTLYVTIKSTFVHNTFEYSPVDTVGLINCYNVAVVVRNKQISLRR